MKSVIEYVKNEEHSRIDNNCFDFLILWKITKLYNKL
jgi:hypothetical protein